MFLMLFRLFQRRKMNILRILRSLSLISKTIGEFQEHKAGKCTLFNTMKALKSEEI